jgi:hypothetical protein
MSRVIFMKTDEDRKAQTAAANAARRAAAKQRREEKAAQMLREAGWTCQPPHSQAA